MSEPQAAPFMSIIPSRTPKNKAHLRLGDAKKAVLHKFNGAELDVPCLIYQWVPGEGWEKLWQINAGTKRQDLPWE